MDQRKRFPRFRTHPGIHDTSCATITRGSDTQTRSFNRAVPVTFPADNQGNVTLTVNDKTCQLNLVTHAVTNCQ